MSGQCNLDFEPRIVHLINLRIIFFNSLSGPFFFFNPISVIGFVIARVVPQIPYLHAGTRWALGKKHDGKGL